MNVIYGRGYVYAIQYHVVWCVKYRKKIINEAVETRLKEILTEIARDNGFSISELNTDKDHIHFLLSYDTTERVATSLKL